jgi:hypothetical protein
LHNNLTDAKIKIVIKSFLAKTDSSIQYDFKIDANAIDTNEMSLKIYIFNLKKYEIKLLFTLL